MLLEAAAADALGVAVRHRLPYVAMPHVASSCQIFRGAQEILVVQHDLDTSVVAGAGSFVFRVSLKANPFFCFSLLKTPMQKRGLVWRRLPC